MTRTGCGMATTSDVRTRARCACGKVTLALTGRPIVSVVCYCDDCQAAARRIEALTNAPPVAEPDGGSALLLYRKDRMSVVDGDQLLRADKLKPGSATNRMIATCCNTALFIGFDRGPHWVSVFRSRLAGDRPPIDMSIQTRFRRVDAPALPDRPPHYATYPFGLLGKLVRARIAMLLGR